uniref:Uncharacterized protein n=2 Tax=Caenorhabditis japonica TaxID=281687 RepID=A0A8R1DTV8_CAEJA
VAKPEMIIEQRKHHALNLEAIDNELRMEQARQRSEKLAWEQFGRVEKRQTLDARTRLDVLNSLAFMRENMPIDDVATAAQKVKQLADSLGENSAVIPSPGGFTIKSPDVTIEIGISEENFTACKIGYFGQPLFDAPDALALMKCGEFTELRDAVSDILGALPKGISM